MAKFSVVVLNYNGDKVVLPCLRSVATLSWPGMDVVVVDNASTDGSADRISEEFGEQVSIIRRQINSPTAGRNEGLLAASGDYVLSLDNDIVLTDAMALRRAATIFDRFPNVGVLVFKICGSNNPGEPLVEHWWHPVPVDEGKDRFFYTDWFPEGAVIFRASTLRATGAYDVDLFHGFESVDFAMRLLDQGFQMLYCPTLSCVEIRERGWHHEVRSNINYLTLRNKLWTVWKDYPVTKVLSYAATRIVAGAVKALRYGWVDLWWSAVKEGVAAPKSIRAKRRPVSAATWNHIQRIRKGMYCDEVQGITETPANSRISSSLYRNRPN